MDKDVTFGQIEDVLEEAWKDYPYKEELLSNGLVHIYVPGCGDLIMDRDEWYAIDNFRNKKDSRLHEDMVKLFDKIKKV